MSEPKAVKARIVLPAPRESGVTLTQGTQVFVGDQKLAGVTAITLRGEVGDFWRATIDCIVVPPREVVVPAVVKRKNIDPWWRRILRRMRHGELDVTNMDSTIREFRR